MGSFSSAFEGTYPNYRLVVRVDGCTVLDCPVNGEDFVDNQKVPAFQLELSQPQMNLIANKTGISQFPLTAFVEEVELPFLYTWANGREPFDGAISFSIPLGHSGTVHARLAYGERDTHGEENRKKLLLITKLAFKANTGMKNTHGYSTVSGEATGSDDYFNSKKIFCLLGRKAIHGYYENSDYPNSIPPELVEFASTSLGAQPLTMKNLLNGKGWDRLVFSCQIQETMKLLKFALVKAILQYYW